MDSRGLRPPPLQTSFHKPTTALQQSGPPAAMASSTSHADNIPPTYSSTVSSHGNASGPKHRSSEAAQLPPIPQQRTQHHSHQRFVLTDPLAFKYLEEDPSTTVLERRKELRGYECYVVEQWSTSRSHPTFTITTHTGDPNHSVIVGVLSVPTDENTWSPRLRVYFKALNQYHAKRRETPLGILMVTNLSGFPSSLTVIPVPDGDLLSHRLDYIVNENLKRLGCSGRAGLTLAPPSGATIAKFHQLYRTSEKNDLYKSVIDLVRLCQSALMLFDKLEIDYADGLLCDVTERAINDWWLDMGSEYYNVEPHDGILGPTTMSGLLGLLMGARNRLHAANCPVPKDPFDVEEMKRGISSFQKQHRLPRTRRLDRRTLERLQRSTVKAANSEGWTVPKAVKSTVAELSGRGGEMIADAVGRRDRAGIAEIETTDIDRFTQLLYGERCKWLWYGRPMKKTARTGGSSGPSVDARPVLSSDLTFRQDEHGGFTWTARKSVGNGLLMQGIGQDNDLASPVQEEDGEDSFKGVFKRSQGFKDAKSGLGRFRGAVGLGGHQRQMSKNESPQSPQSPLFPAEDHRRRPVLRRAQSSPGSTPTSPQSPTQDRYLDRSFAAQQREDTIPEDEDLAPTYAASVREVHRMSKDSLAPPSYRSMHGDGLAYAGSDVGSATDPDDETQTIEPSIAGSIYNDVAPDEVPPTGPETEEDVRRLLQRTASYSQYIDVQIATKSDDAYPRHLSFSLAEENLLTWDPISSPGDDFDEIGELTQQMLDQNQLAAQYRVLRQQIRLLETETTPFTTSSLSTLSTLLTHLSTSTDPLQQTFDSHHSASNSLQTASDAVLRSEREQLEEGGKELETLSAKLEYEIQGLRGRVEDVEVGVAEFERGVGRAEERVGELEREGERAERRGWCVVM